MRKISPKTAVFADFKNLLAIKKKVRGLMMPATRKVSLRGIGTTRSPFRTRGLDFQEVRAYQPGDDIRQIDWRVTAKYGKPYTKLYTDEKERSIFFVCDMRSSMKFASAGHFKSVVVARIAAFLSFLALKKGDTVGFTIIRPDGLEIVPPEAGEGAVISFLHSLSEASDPTEMPIDKISLTQGIKETLPYLRRGSIVFVLSDFTDLTVETVQLLPQLTAHRTVSLIHIYDLLEADLPAAVFPITDGEHVRFLDMMTDKKQYQSGFEQVQNALADAVQKYQLGYLTVLTNEPDLERVAAYVKGATA